MRFVNLIPTESTTSIQSVYGTFDLGLDGRPNALWEARNLKSWRPPEMLEHSFFPGFWIARLKVNRRIMGALERVYLEIGARWTSEVRAAHGLNQFVKCYCFGDGDGPNLHWYGAAWELSPKLRGEHLAEVSKIFSRHGFNSLATSDKQKSRTFEYWG